jgi:hypothetical protein
MRMQVCELGRSRGQMSAELVIWSGIVAGWCRREVLAVGCGWGSWRALSSLRRLGFCDAGGEEEVVRRLVGDDSHLRGWLPNLSAGDL